MTRLDHDGEESGVDARFIEASARLLGLSITPEWLDSIQANMRTLEVAAALVSAYPLSDDAEPAPIYRA